MKNIFFASCLIFISSNLQAQFKFSIGGGANFSNLIVKNLDSFKPRANTNYFLSVKPEFSLTENLSVAVDIQFSQKGFGLGDDSLQAHGGYKLQYLDLIPQVQYKIINQLGIYGGLGIGIRGSEKYKINGAWEEAVTKISSGTDFTYVFGIRVFPTDKLFIHAHYAGSMSSFYDVIFTDIQGNEIENVNTRLRNFQLGIGYQLF